MLMIAVLVVLAAPTATARHNGKRCFGLPVTQRGTHTDEPILGTDGRDVIHAGPGDDTIIAGEGNDLICGGGGDDVIHGGTGFDRARGGRGSDSCIQVERTRGCE